MYLGIDLGTSNSAIVGTDGAEIRLFKTADGTDVLPSVININKLGHKFVGSRAYQQALLSPENVAQGFKRLMGTSSPVKFKAADLAMLPEECSAEIIRTLLGQVRTEAGDIEIEGTVVTIPAAFNQMQCEATIRAAEIAGLERVGLLQEPIAAAMASMAHAKNKNGQFLVYDLGGGTFDVALVQSVNGTVSVVAHEGINMLGGRDFDRNIVNSLVRPWLINNFNLPPDFQSDKRFSRLIGVARAAAERAKIELSSADRTIIFAGDEDVRVQDLDGTDVYLDVEITRKDLDGLTCDHIDATIELCRKILREHGYSHEDIDRVVFIGGPSKMPWVRSRVPQELGIAADLNTDPMTAVAVGAAIFAESRDWSGSSSARKTTRGMESSRGAVEIRYDFPARTSEDRARIRVRPSSAIDGKGFTLQAEGSEGGNSGFLAITSDLVVQVPLPKRGENVIRITVLDPAGRPVASASTLISITKTFASAAGIPATQTVSVKIVDSAGGSERNMLEPLVEKGTLLPAKGTKTFKAARSITGGGEGHIDVDLYQQSPGVPEPELNLFVGSFRIDAEKHLEKGETLRRGEEILIHWHMDDNGLLNSTIEIPSIGRTFDTDKFYADTAGHQNFDGQDGAALAYSVLADAERELAAAEQSIGASAGTVLDTVRAKLLTQRNELAQAHDADSRRSVTEEARGMRQELSRLRHAPEHRAAILRQELAEAERTFNEDIRDDADPRVCETFDRLASTVRSAISANVLDDAERALKAMDGIVFRELLSQMPYLIQFFRNLAAERYLAVDKALHDLIVDDGETAAEAQDRDALRKAISRLFDNRFTVGGGDKALNTVASLMRG